MRQFERTGILVSCRLDNILQKKLESKQLNRNDFFREITPLLASLLQVATDQGSDSSKKDSGNSNDNFPHL